MFSGLFALLERSLRVDGRAWGPHVARGGLMIAIAIAVTYATTTSTMFGAPGLRFFRSISGLNLVFMTLLGIGFFSTAITEEKEEDTLGLMLMAGISPLGILLGKLGGRLVQALLLIAVQYPFTLLAVTMGGVTQQQVWSTYLGLIAYMVMLAGVGLCCSTLSDRNRTASFRLVIVLVIYWVVPLLCQRGLVTLGITSPFLTTLMTVVSESCIFLQIGTILTTGFSQGLWTNQVATNLLIGGCAFLLSWALFDFSVREPALEASSRRLVSRARGRLTWFAPGRSWSEPLVWKDFHFVAGGTVGVLLRFAVYGALYFVALGMTHGRILGVWGPTPAKATDTLFLTLLMFAVAFDASLVVSGSLHEEVRSQTLASLLLLPASTGRVLYGKIVGSLLGWLPGPAALLLGVVLAPHGAEVTSSFFREGGAAFWLIAHLILVPHLAAVLALYVRWGAIPIAIGIAFASLFLSVSLFQAVRADHNAPIVWVVILGLMAVCAATHLFVWLKAEALSAR